MFWQSLVYFAATTPDCAADKKMKLFGIIPKWYQYLPYELSSTTGNCEITLDLRTSAGPTQFWFIGLSIVEILLRIAGLLAVIFIIYGGFKLVTSQGEPDAAKAARNTITNALIGVVIAVLGSSIVHFIATRI